MADDDKKITMHDLEAQMEAEVRDNFDDEAKDPDFDPSDWITELADGNVPIYNYDLLMLAADDLWLAVEVPEIYAFNGDHSAVNAIAGNVYERLREVGYAEFDRLKAEAEEGE